MDIATGQHLIGAAINPKQGFWIDIGAGTGLFTEVLFQTLTSGKVIAMDKNPHALWRLKAPTHLEFEILEADFNRTLDFPKVDGMIMANALHYAEEPVAVLKNILQFLKPNAPFILVEYELNQPRKPWIPYPVPFKRFKKLAPEVNLSTPKLLTTVPSRYGPNDLFSCVSIFQNEC